MIRRSSASLRGLLAVTALAALSARAVAVEEPLRPCDQIGQAGRLQPWCEHYADSTADATAVDGDATAVANAGTGSRNHRYMERGQGHNVLHYFRYPLAPTLSLQPNMIGG